MGRVTKQYKLSRDFSMECVIDTNYYGENKYSVYVLLDCVPWREEVEAFQFMRDKDEANGKFLELKAKYKGRLVTDCLIKE